MVCLRDCIPCQDGNHDRHYEVTQAVPEGMIGGARCPCTGDCAERKARRDEASSRPCPCCEGAGCEECDHTGQRVTTQMAIGDTTARIIGSAPLSPGAIDALGQLMAAAAAQMTDSRTPPVRPCPQWSMDHCTCLALDQCQRWASHDSALREDRA